MPELHPSLLRGRAALAQRQLPAAYQAVQEALRANPADAQAHALAGIVLAESQDLSSGEWHFRRALQLDPALAECAANLAINLIRQGRAEEAEPFFIRADQLSPDNPQILAQWSRLHEFQNDLQHAEELLDRAAAVSSAREVELLRIIYLARAGQHQQALAMLDAAPELNGEAQLERGRLHDRLGQHQRAWRDWTEGKIKLAAQTGAADYQASVVDALCARLQRFFVRTPNMELLPYASLREGVAQPVFIIGVPRSGTTLIEQILASHPAVRAGGELTFANEWPQLISRLLPGATSFPESLAQTCTADWHHVAFLMRDYYFARAEARGLLQPGKRCFTDKMPFNEMWLPLIRMAFPGAKIVRAVRHPLDICVSMLSHQMTHGFDCGYRPATIVRHLCAMFDLSQHYRREFTMDECTLRYEDLVRHPEDQVRRLLDHLQLPFDPACLSFHAHGRYAATPSYAQVSEKPHDRSIGRYRHYMEQLSPFVPQLTPWLQAWGYGV